jgi:hypothetical protein
VKLHIHCLSGHGIAITVEVAMPTSSIGLGLRAYVGDGTVLLAFKLDPNELKTNGLAFQCARIAGAPFLLKNRLNFSNPVTPRTVSQQMPQKTRTPAPRKRKVRKKTVAEV